MHSLSTDRIEIWTVRLNDPSLNENEFRQFLSADERKKADRYRINKDRHNYTLTRGILRQLIGHYLNGSAASINFHYTPQGKPYIPNKALAFNISHSGEQALLAFSAAGNIGIDLERMQHDFDFYRIQQRYFSNEQVAAISNSSDSYKIFYQFWTLKEAFIKAIGSGLFRDLGSFDIPLNATTFTDSNDGKEWQIRTLNIDPDYAAAIVFDTPATQIKLHRYPNECPTTDKTA